MVEPLKTRKYIEIILVILILFSSLFIRLYGIENDTVNPDDPAWVIRTMNFLEKIKSGNLMAFSESAHPGVTLLGSGGLAYLISGYADDKELIKNLNEVTIFNYDAFRETTGKGSLIGRLNIAIFSSLLLFIAYFLLRKVFEIRIALLSYALLAIDPYYVAHGRLLQLDSLLSTFLLLSLISFVAYLINKKHYLVLLSGLFGALSFLTRSPAVYLLPYIFVAVVVWMVYDIIFSKSNISIQLKSAGKIFVLWILYFIAFVFLFNPSMWVSPVGVISFIFGRAAEVGFVSHKSFFFGRDVEVSNFLYYIVAVPYRMTPITLLSIPLWITAFFDRRSKYFNSNSKKSMMLFTIFAAGYSIMMSIPNKRGERYLLPALLILIILSAAGICWLAERINISRFVLKEKLKSKTVSLFLIFALMSIATTATMDALVFPHYLSYYNPILGGGRTAYRNILVGWGEGMKDAADYLNSKPDAEAMNISVWYEQSITPFFKGKARSMGFYNDKGDVDYVLLYINEIQRYRIKEMVEKYYFNSKPEKIIWLNNIPYVFIYKKFYPVNFGDRDVVILSFADSTSDQWCTRSWGTLEMMGRWGLGEYSIASIDLKKDFDYEISIGVKALDKVIEDQTLRVLFNGKEIGNFNIESNDEIIFDWLEMRIPSEFVDSGPDELRFEYGYFKRPSELGINDDSRNLALLFSSMRIKKVSVSGN